MNKTPLDNSPITYDPCLDAKHPMNGIKNCLPPPIFTLLSAVLSHVHTALINFPNLEYGTHESKQITQLCRYDVVKGTGDEH